MTVVIFNKPKVILRCCPSCGWSMDQKEIERASGDTLCGRCGKYSVSKFVIREIK